MKEKSILIVEDEMIVAMMIKLKLLEMGYKIAEYAVSGEQALIMVNKKVPDLVIMDIHLKGKLDGIETATEMESRYSIPIIFLTGDSFNEKTARSSFANRAGYLQKPFMEKELEYAIRSAIHKHIDPARNAVIAN
ncbi:response regulator [Methanococcoides burtonii]|uniref:YycF-like response regulator receiver n=1 Tax=Methanococcoides burtonii (strain DSM 6242 / NBRC 107633 / OCM 468 / ACE-M) TaxID=259564 RepID=Q12XN8_METBU|nr:response regulator [Methanococcoides burtonii]ABE51788.1 yycF-like response regulator receiver [Methanococcoides burtonii DSM 6242]